MPMPKRQYRKSRKSIARVVRIIRACAFLARKKFADADVVVIAHHILDTLSPARARRFAAGDIGPIVEVAKPFFMLGRQH